MGWTWVNDLFAPEHRKKDMSYERRCPYFGGVNGEGCPSNSPFRGARPARLKFVQKISPMVYQYKCKDCGCLSNHGVEVPWESDDDVRLKSNPALYGGKASFKFHV